MSVLSVSSVWRLKLTILTKLTMQKIITIMAHYKPTDGFGYFTGALSKKKIQGVHHMTVTRRKRVKDPLSGEVVGLGPKEIYVQERRNYNEHPMTEGEVKQRNKWREACRMASVIIHTKSHPRYMELYHRWREHILTTDTPMQFPNFVRHVLSQEG